MMILEKIKAEIAEIEPLDYPCDKREPEHIRDMALEIVEKYAEQEPTIGQLFSCEEVEELRNKIWKQVEQKPCDDVVSRQAVLKIFEDMFIELQKAHQKDTQYGVNWCINTLKDMPSVRPQEPKTGHWILDETDNSITCDKCGCLIWANDICNGDAHYCPNCGARMVEPQESEDKE